MKSPSFALRMATSLGFLLVFAPYLWRFGADMQIALLMPLSLAGLWGWILKRDARVSRREQDWELFYFSFFFLAGSVSFLALMKFQVAGQTGLFPPHFLAPALILTALGSLLCFRQWLRDFGWVERILIGLGLPPLLFLLCVGVLGYLNGALDFGAARTHAVAIQGKRMSAGKHRRLPLLRVAFWHDATRKTMVEVTKNDWERAETGKTALVRVKPGLLGGEWVESARLK